MKPIRQKAYDGGQQCKAGSQIEQCCYEEQRVIAQQTYGPIAPVAQEPADASTARLISMAAAPVMVYREFERLTGSWAHGLFGFGADGAHAALLCKQRVVLPACNAVTATKLMRAGPLRVCRSARGHRCPRCSTVAREILAAMAGREHTPFAFQAGAAGTAYLAAVGSLLYYFFHRRLQPGAGHAAGPAKVAAATSWRVS
jgi:hypothetical protein